MTIRTAFIEVVLEEPGTGKPQKGLGVTVELNAPAFTDGGRVQKLGRRIFTSDDTGTVRDPAAGALPEFEINDDIDPAGTWYSMRIPGMKNLWTFQLTAAHAGQTVQLRDVLQTNPLNPDPLVITHVILQGNLDGGAPDSVYTASQILDGGTP